MAKNRNRKLTKALLMVGLSLTIGYVKCMRDVVNQHSDALPDGITVSPFKGFSIGMSKKEGEK